MRVNARMSDLLGRIEPCVREEYLPDLFRGVVRGSWVVDGGVHLLTVFSSGYSGAASADFEDMIHYEATVNSRGMLDYDLPNSGIDRSKPLLERLAYACMALVAVPASWPWSILGYVSLSEGGIDDDLLTAHVTFCSRRDGLPPYVKEIDSYTHEALMEISQDDAATMLARASPFIGA
jgi:hypothetical protein